MEQDDLPHDELSHNTQGEDPARGRTDAAFHRETLRAAQLGSVDAQRTLGVMYATGEWSAPKDLTEAARWYRLAAEHGDATSQYELGFMLLLGEDQPRDVEQGLNWIERAAGQGQREAVQLLIDCFGNGSFNIPVDHVKAKFWASRVDKRL